MTNTFLQSPFHFATFATITLPYQLILQTPLPREPGLSFDSFPLLLSRIPSTQPTQGQQRSDLLYPPQTDSPNLPRPFNQKSPRQQNIDLDRAVDCGQPVSVLRRTREGINHRPPFSQRPPSLARSRQRSDPRSISPLRPSLSPSNPGKSTSPLWRACRQCRLRQSPKTSPPQVGLHRNYSL